MSETKCACELRVKIGRLLLAKGRYDPAPCSIEILYCPLHAAALKLLEACKAVLIPYGDLLRGVGADPRECESYRAIKAAITEAGRKS